MNDRRDGDYVGATRVTSETVNKVEQTDLAGMFGRVPVVPVLTIETVETGVALAEALVAGGLPVLEVTLRTDAALAAIEAIDRHVVGAVVGAGTVLSARNFESVERVGARFAVSPGGTPALLDAADQGSVPLLPGATTPSEVMAMAARGYNVLKFFPAGPSGGTGYLKALAGPFPDVRFCPTGGINQANAADYLALESVICVGGSWVAPADAVADGDWQRITTLAKAAAALRGNLSNRPVTR